MRRTIAKLSAGLVLLGAATSAVPAVASATDQLESAIALTRNRDNLDLAIQNLLRFEV